ncbi:MAG: hydrogenase [Candidatus Riflebacteria bacterium]|nr:hydrogenase [Candidatus Riflebacteria bacterium]
MVLLTLLAPCIAVFAALIALVTSSFPRLCSALSALAAILISAVGIIPVLSVLAGNSDVIFAAPWEIPYGSLAIRLDALSAFFLLPVFCLGSLTALYGSKYLLHSQEKINVGFAWFCFHILFASMIIVILAGNGLLFLLAWELTVVSSFFLVVLESSEEKNRQAGWIYLTASHFGTSFLIVLFLIAARESGSMDFSAFSKLAQSAPELKGFLFLLAVLGFGTKAGFIPFHVWLPEAHPAAPSHVSALMSGVMIKTGIYGLVRILFYLGTPSLWWGWLLLTIGIVSGIAGVLFAISQHDIKRLLAYSSVENIGIMAIGFGLGLIGLNQGNTAVAILSFSGGVLHVLNHAVFKGLLFLGAGAVIQQTGTREIDRMGGLLKRMPWTGTSFLIGCLSISGLPPFNGFVSEFLIYFAALLAILSGSAYLAGPGFLVIVALSLIGGLAAACFTKAFSIIFLGSPRSTQTSEPHDAVWEMKIPMVILASLCALIAVFSPVFLKILHRIFLLYPELALKASVEADLNQATLPLKVIIGCSFLLTALIALIYTYRNKILSGRKVDKSVTWDCGYSLPSVSMQYTGSSFAQPLTELFYPILRSENHLTHIKDYFPRKASFLSRTSDVFLKSFFTPLFNIVSYLLHKLTTFQSGIVQNYIGYISVTLAVLLVLGLL